MSSLTSTPTDAWTLTLLLKLSAGQYLQLGRPATPRDYWGLMAMAQELNGWTVIVA